MKNKIVCPNCKQEVEECDKCEKVFKKERKVICAYLHQSDCLHFCKNKCLYEYGYFVINKLERLVE
jgi:hypothetical protein